MKTAGKKFYAALLCGLVLLCALLISGTSLKAEAAAWKDINDPSVFLKQQESDTCTLCANVMMLRRTAMMRGDSDWRSITESSVKPVAWLGDVGMYHSYSYSGISVTSGSIYGDPRSELISLLKEHPEGIVAYDFDYPHAILLTDYTNGVFYCAEPANNVASGRVRAEEALVPIDGIEFYWVVESPDVKLTDTPQYTEKKCDEYWRVTNSKGAGLRSKVEGSTVSTVPKGVLLHVTKKVTTDNGSWGYVTYKGKSGWIILSSASKVTPKELSNGSSLSAQSVTKGFSITVKGAASGGTEDYQYAYYCRRSTDAAWTVLKNYSASTSVKYTPTSSGKMMFFVRVKDSAGHTAGKTLELNVCDPVTNTSSISKSAMTLGNSVTVKGSTKGGIGPIQYAYFYKRAGDAGASLIKSYSSSTSVTFRPTLPGKYEITVYVKDSKNHVSSKHIALTVNPSLQNTSTISSLVVTEGQTVTIRGSAKGGTGAYKYAYYYRAANTDWKLFSDYSAMTSYSFKAKTDVHCEVMVRVKDADDRIVKKSFRLTVKKSLKNNSTASAKTLSGRKTVYLSGSAQGGTGVYQYAYYFKRSTSSSWTAIRDYSEIETVGFNPSSSGTFDFMICVKDSEGTVVQKLITLTV